MKCISLYCLIRIFLFMQLMIEWKHVRVQGDDQAELTLIRARCIVRCSKTFDEAGSTKLFKRQKRRAASNYVSTSSESSDDQTASLKSKALNQCSKSSDSGNCRAKCRSACLLNHQVCEQECNKDIVCQLGCFYLRQSFYLRSGQCPLLIRSAPVSSSSFPRESEGDKCAQHHTECRMDSDCHEVQSKCCPVDNCGLRCFKADFNTNIPILAPKLEPLVTSAANTVDLDWSKPYGNLTSSSNPLIFVLQIRYCDCKIYMPDYMTPWQNLTITPTLGAHLDQFARGMMYQIRLAAVSSEGSRGFGPPSDPFVVDNMEPRPPKPPRNVTDRMWRIYAGGKISVVIHWEPSRQHDLAITAYQVLWVLDHGYLQSDGQTVEGLTSFVQSVPATQQHHLIDNLLPNTSYKVQVRAVTYWKGHGDLTSQPNTIFISTPDVNPPTPKLRSNKMVELITSRTRKYQACHCEEESKSHSSIQFKIYKPEYYMGDLTATLEIVNSPASKQSELKYLVQWSKKVCIDSDDTIKEINQAVIQDTVKAYKGSRMRLNKLNFNCRYAVHVISQISYQDDTMMSSVNCFCTPTCHDVFVPLGSPHPKCLTDKSEIPASPLAISATLTNESTLTYRLSWKSPFFSRNSKDFIQVNSDPKESPDPPGATMWSGNYQPERVDRSRRISFSRYRVIWGPRKQEPVNKEMYNDEAGFTPILDFKNSNVRVVSSNITSILLSNLKPATFYVVRIQCLTVDDIDPLSSRLGKDMESERASLPAVYYFTTKGFKNTNGFRFSKTPAEVAKFIRQNNDNSSHTKSVPSLMTLSILSCLLHFLCKILHSHNHTLSIQL